MLNHWWINFWQLLSQPEWEHVRFKSACSNQIRQRKCSVFVCFRVSLCHSTLGAYTDVEHVHFRRVVPAFGTVFIGTVPVTWIERAGQLTADVVASVWTLWIQSPLGPRQFGGFFVGYRPFPAAREKNNTNIYVYMRVCVYVYMHIRMLACLSPCTCVCPHACVYCGIVQYLRWGV